MRYDHPDFVTNITDLRDESENKRYYLELTINSDKSENIVVIMKNPSKASHEISDCTVYRVTNYIHRNANKKELQNIGKIIILNLIPLYETYSGKLVESAIPLEDKKNIDIIDKYCSENEKVIIAWGNYPKGLRKEYEQIKCKVFKILEKHKNKVFYVQSLSKSNNPKHGQIWGYNDTLKSFTKRCSSSAFPLPSSNFRVSSPNF